MPATAAVAAAVGYFEFVDYVERDPRFCSQCHQSEPELMLWMRSRHRTVVCQECHHESREGALGVLLELVVHGNRPDDAQRVRHTADVRVDSCERCHLSHDNRWPQIGRSAGHLVHVNRAEIACLRCHGQSIHGMAGPGEGCRECHADRSIQMDGMGDNHCLSCHNFLTTNDDLAPSRERCLECHKARGMLGAIFPEGAPMSKLLCAACHRPHANASNVHVPCLTCHQDAPKAGLHAHPDHQACEKCHSAHVWEPRQPQCLECHAAQISHYRHQRCWSCHDFKPGAGLAPPSAPPNLIEPSPGSAPAAASAPQGAPP